jgi:hypothetical protein
MTQTSNSSDINTRITDKIVADLEQGVRPWFKPWSAEHAAGKINRLVWKDADRLTDEGRARVLGDGAGEEQDRRACRELLLNSTDTPAETLCAFDNCARLAKDSAGLVGSGRDRRHSHYHA